MILDAITFLMCLYVNLNALFTFTIVIKYCGKRHSYILNRLERIHFTYYRLMMLILFMEFNVFCMKYTYTNIMLTTI